MLAVSWREDSLERAETLAAVKSAKKVSLDAENGLTDAQHSGPAQEFTYSVLLTEGKY